LGRAALARDRAEGVNPTATLARPSSENIPVIRATIKPWHSFASGMTDIRAASIDAIPFGSDVKRTPPAQSPKKEEETSMAWYVSYRTGGSTVMHIFRRRELAIAAACEFFGRGSHDALEVGPMLGTRKGNLLDERDLQRIRSATPASAARA